MSYSYNYTASGLDYASLGAALGAYMGVVVVIGILSIVAMWKIFTKAGKPGWASIVPIYNIVVMFQISGLNPWLILLFLIPFANIVIMIMMYVKLAKAFDKGTGFALGLIFLNTIFVLILGFGNSKYIGTSK